MLDKFEGEFPKLSESNSVVVGSRIIYFKKVDGIYVCWDYRTKIKVAAVAMKDIEQSKAKASKGKPSKYKMFFLEWLNKNEKEIEERLCKITTNTSRM
jgi:hypothetical protein